METKIDKDYHKLLKDAAEASKLAWKKEHKLRQEAEGELSIMKGIETNRVKESQAKSSQLQNELDRVKEENNNLYNKIADLTEVKEGKKYIYDKTWGLTSN